MHIQCTKELWSTKRKELELDRQMLYKAIEQIDNELSIRNDPEILAYGFTYCGNIYKFDTRDEAYSAADELLGEDGRYHVKEYYY